VLKRLELPYRTMLLCSGDMGFASAKTYDIEVWLPGRTRTARSRPAATPRRSRRGARTSSTGRREREAEFATPERVGLAVGRTLIAILENYQQADGTVVVPRRCVRSWRARRDSPADDVRVCARTRDPRH
jgi:seryl-tRNA synthetase